MNVVFWSLMTILTFIVQTQVSPFDRPINLTAALVFLYALRNIPQKPHVKGYWSGRGEIKAAAFGALIGMLEDALSNSVIGPSMISKSLSCIVCVVLFSDIFLKWTALFGALTLALITAADTMLMSTLRYILTEININYMALFQTILMQAFLNVPLGFLIASREGRSI